MLLMKEREFNQVYSYFNMLGVKQLITLTGGAKFNVLSASRTAQPVFAKSNQ